MDDQSTIDRQPGRLDRFLRLFSEVQPGEGVTAVLLALNIFLILTAYYILKPVREALILGQGSAELKSYVSVGQVLLLAVVVPLYARLVARLLGENSSTRLPFSLPDAWLSFLASLSSSCTWASCSSCGSVSSIS